MTLWIEYHHIHHLTTRAPCYRLQEAHESEGGDMLWVNKLGVVRPDRLEMVRTLTFTTDDTPRKFVESPRCFHRKILGLI